MRSQRSLHRTAPWPNCRRHDGRDSEAGQPCPSTRVEDFYFGRNPQIVVDGVANRVRPGDVFKLSPGEAHDIVNDTDHDTRLIFIKAPYRPKDKVDLG